MDSSDGDGPGDVRPDAVPPAPAPLWHVTVTVTGDELPAGQVRAALERLSHAQPLMLAARYATCRAELRYWEEAPTVLHAAALAVRLWDEQRAPAALPDWQVVGLEVVDRDTYHLRFEQPALVHALVRAGDIRPF